MMIMKDDIIVGLCSYDNDPDLWFAEGVMEAPRGRPTPDEIKVSIIRTADALRICSNCPVDRKSTRLNSSHSQQSRMPSSA